MPDNITFTKEDLENGRMLFSKSKDFQDELISYVLQNRIETESYLKNISRITDVTEEDIEFILDILGCGEEYGTLPLKFFYDLEGYKSDKELQKLEQEQERQREAEALKMSLESFERSTYERLKKKYE